MARTYGISEEDYQYLLRVQKNKCAICGKAPRKRYLAVDHDHIDTHVRGLLCYNCNTALGIWEFDEDTATRAANYLLMIADDHKRRRLAFEEAKSHRVVQDELPF